MSVLLETSVGDVVIDLFTDKSPRCCENFLKLCKLKYYNFSPIYNVQKNFSFQGGDPIGPGSAASDGGSSCWGLLDGPTRKNFSPEFHPSLKHVERGTVSMATVAAANDPDHRLAGSQFIITLGDELKYLDGKAAIFGKVVEGFDALEKVNSTFVDETGRPLKDIRVRHTVVLEDPYNDPPGLVVPPESPVPSAAQLATVRIADDEDVDDNADEETLEKLRREREARAQALTLEMVGDLPFAEVKPPENILFICKLNPVTQDEDLKLIFSQFGTVISCEVIRDKRTGDSLQYAFIEFEQQQECEQAYFKMQDVLIDDHRVHVDFSQSVSKLSDLWRNATQAKRSSQAVGFGGISGLEKRRHYRQDPRDGMKVKGRKYGMVFDERNKSMSGERWRSRPDNGGPRSRSRSPNRTQNTSELRRHDGDRNRVSTRDGQDYQRRQA